MREEIVAANPCRLVARNPSRARERVLSDAEVALFWQEFDSVGLAVGGALKVLLLCGQRPGETCHMRAEHVRGGCGNCRASQLQGSGRALKTV